MGYYPYACAICGGGDYRCPTAEHEDGDCCGDCWEDNCVIIPGSVIWYAGRQGKAPALAVHYEATYGGYGDFTVPGAPVTVAFITADDLSNRSMAEIVSGLDKSVEFLFVCQVACASCWVQKVEVAATPAPTTAGAAISDEDDSAT
jgi:hypothetical protein